ncbi:putative transmembrane protein [Gregarina niphandrodes]|uniref:Transmembrane protein n=1 Tax=Gregarina niphandrodes TaxID=110365 RepID=A0A023BB84_GRENI|nr:putative transmembrane protein [Gregarina niphandrodes]EZG79281.1 putative transmembrane protein [Gregarina niphandrodes]|eukprot:XP_011129084.1 putative transmembrane protein [Gregarina niphandrodes]
MKLGDRDLTAILKLVSSIRRIQLKHLSSAVRVLDRHAMDHEMRDTMQLAQNLSRANTKILATFHQIPVTRSILIFANFWRKTERVQVQYAFNKLMLHTKRHRLVVRLCVVLDAIVTGVLVRFHKREPFNMLRVHADQEAVSEARQMMELAKIRADEQIRLCSQRCAVVCIERVCKRANERYLKFSTSQLRRNALTLTLAQEKEAFLDYHGALVRVGKRTAMERMACTLVNSWERKRRSQLFEGYIKLLVANKSEKMRLSILKEKAIFNLTAYIERRRVLLLNESWKTLRHILVIAPQHDALLLQSVSQAIVSAQKTASEIEVCRKVGEAREAYNASRYGYVLPKLTAHRQTPHTHGRRNPSHDPSHDPYNDSHTNPYDDRPEHFSRFGGYGDDSSGAGPGRPDSPGGLSGPPPCLLPSPGDVAPSVNAGTINSPNVSPGFAPLDPQQIDIQQVGIESSRPPQDSSHRDGLSGRVAERLLKTAGRLGVAPELLQPFMSGGTSPNYSELPTPRDPDDEDPSLAQLRKELNLTKIPTTKQKQQVKDHLAIHSPTSDRPSPEDSSYDSDSGKHTTPKYQVELRSVTSVLITVY